MLTEHESKTSAAAGPNGPESPVKSPAAVPDLSARRTHVYVIHDGERAKIGVATDMRRRREALQSGNPKALVLAFHVTAASKTHAHQIERHAHQALAEYRIGGEWFAVGWERAAEAIEAAYAASPPPEPAPVRRPPAPLPSGHEWAMVGRISYCTKCLKLEIVTSQLCSGFAGTIWADYFDAGDRVMVTPA
jgi:hypothetical protein